MENDEEKISDLDDKSQKILPEITATSQRKRLYLRKARKSGGHVKNSIIIQIGVKGGNKRKLGGYKKQ